MPDVLKESREEEQRSKLTTAECARYLGMSTDFIRGEVRDGRLRATIFKPPGRVRAKYVFTVADFEAYQREHWKKATIPSE